jgi:hypothetical protein
MKFDEPEEDILTLNFNSKMFQVHQEQILLIFLDIGLYVDELFLWGLF